MLSSATGVARGEQMPLQAIAELKQQLHYWKTRLADSSPAELLTDYPRPGTLSGHVATIELTNIEGHLLERLNAFCRERQTSAFTVLLAAFRLAHYRLTGAEDATLGISRSGKDTPVGCFVRITVEDDITFDELVQETGSVCKAAAANQAVSFDIIASELEAGQDEASQKPLVRLYFALHEVDKTPIATTSTRTTKTDQVLTYSYPLDLELHLFQSQTPQGEISGRVVYSTDLFKPESIYAVMGVLEETLRRSIHAPRTPISELPLKDGLDELRRMGLFAEEKTDYPHESSIIDVFCQQVARNPYAAAVADSSARMTYAELDERSDELAAWLRWRGMEPETLVAVLAPRSCEAIIAFLGVLKANLAYVPLDVNAPGARIGSILSTISGNKLLLLGHDVAVPDVALVDVDMVRIGDTLNHRSASSGQVQRQENQQYPGPTSLAYVMFTSGSTGRPKGVMVEHRGVVRLVTRTNIIGQAQAVAVSHIANLGFDMATWEIYTALLNGGTVVCIDYMTVLDAAALARKFAKEKIRTALFTPAILKQHLYDIPDAFRQLDLLVTGGEAIRPQDAQEAARLVAPGSFYNAYGPTENTGISTVFRIRSDEKETCADGVPIGRPLTNSGAYVMDRKQNIVTVGVMGELVVTGDGLARGYTNPTLDNDRFIHVSIDSGKPVRAYRTGDRARYRADGQITFFGRIDQQIKIRGHRIEPAEVEDAILGYDGEVCDAAVVIKKHEGQEPEMVGFVQMTATAGVSAEDEEASGQIEGWVSHFESTTYADINKVDTATFGSDFIGWTSMYDGSAIDRDDMQEWLDDTIRTLLDGQGPKRVLEVGTGSGMILYNISKASSGGLERYVGIEPSRSAASFVVKAVRSIPALAGRVEIHVGTATDVAKLDLQEICPELVVINSVMQLFPSPQYLIKVMDTVIRIPGVKRLFLGDIRTNAINRYFLAARALHSLGDRATKAGIRRRIKELEDMEEELLIDPAFFTGLAARHPNVRHVEIIPKRMKATNELSAYRYGAVVYLTGPEQEDAAQPVHAISQDAWVDLEASGMDRQGLRGLLESSSSDVVAVANIPYGKTIVERRLLESLRQQELGDDDDLLDGSDWIAAVRARADSSVSFSAIDLAQLAEETGFRVEISCARQRSRHGALDAVFHRYPAPSDKRVLFHFPTDDDGSPLASLVNRPLQRLQSRRVQAQIRERLQAMLPSYMVPERIIVLDEMPINANGKIDRKELTLLAESMPKNETTRVRVAPRDDIETAVCAEFAAILGVEVGVSDSFFDLGGHSLMATRLAARLSRRLNAAISVKDIFDQPILSDLAALIRQSSTPHQPIQAMPYDGPVQQSFAQGRLWFLDQLDVSGGLSYVIPLATRIRGSLDIGALEAALFALEQRHETLRTTFEERDGIGMQVVQPSGRKSLRVVDVQVPPTDENSSRSSNNNGKNDYVQLLLGKEQKAAFDLAAQPGWRVALLRLGPDDYLLSIVMHHIISDGWSVDVLRQELTQFYAAALRGRDPLSVVNPLPIQYRDFSVWQRQSRQEAEQERQLEYWKTQLANSSPAELLPDLPRPTTQLSGDAQVVQFSIDGSVYDRLHAFCRTHQTTPFTVLLAVFRAAHYRLTGSEDATIGTPIANRNQPDLEGLIGFFVNTQCMRITIAEQDSFNALVQQVRSTTTTAFANQDVPFERIVSALLPGSKDTSRNPLVQLLFALHSQRDLEKVKIHLEGVVTEPVVAQSVTRLDLEFHLFQMPGSLSGKVMYSTDLFYTESINALVGVFQEILRRGLDQPQTPISLIPLTVALDSSQDEETTEYPRDSSVTDVFREQVAARPGAIAITDASSRLTYAELDHQSDRLAAWLRQKDGLTPETMVGVLAPRSCEAIVAFFGILKANLAYVPLDVNAPAARIATILSAMPQGRRKLVLIGQKIVAPDMPLEDTELVRIGDTLRCWQSPDKPEEVNGTAASSLDRPSATSLAYVMFTSGSTGRPKGVMIEHRGILRLATKTNIISSAEVAVPVAHITTLAFDLSTWEIFAPLLNGGTVVCIDYMTLLDVRSLSNVFLKENIRAALLTPAFLKQCLAECPEALSGLDNILACGDRLDARDAIAVCKIAKCGIVNAYGPTENTTFSTIYRMKADINEPCVNGVPIGRPISNSGAYIMDRRQHPLPVGVMGELVVTGDGLARGYTDSSLDRDRFVSIQINGKSIKAYRTGDRARRRPKDGEIEFFGRMDQQIKIRGHRIEPAEAEHAMLAQEAVRDAAVVVRVHESREPELFGFALVDADSSESTGPGLPGQKERGKARSGMETQIRNRLQLVLPSYMVPERIVILDEMPLNSNGKVDRKQLARMAENFTKNETASDATVAPRNELEAVVCEEFATMVGVEVGIKDNFFNKGGHSLMATKLAARLSRRLNTRISVKDVFDHPVLGDLAEIIRRSSARHNPIVGTTYSGPVEQSFAQGRLWFLEQLNLGTFSYMIPVAVRLRGPLHVDALQAALAAIESRHETLRTTFHEKDGVGFQAVRPCKTPTQALRVINIAEHEGEGQAKYLEVLRREQTTPFNLVSEPGWRVALIRLGQDHHILSIVMHHIISDGWSVDVLRDELARFYGVAVAGEDPLSVASSLPVQYRDFSIWQKQQTAEHQRQLNYWRTQLAESSPAELLCDYPRPKSLSGHAGTVEIMPIEGPLYEQLLAFCRAQQTTPFTVLFAAFRAAHFRLTSLEDATVGIPVANRNRSELEHMIGFFVNTQCVRTVVGDDVTFGQLVQQVRTAATAAFANQDVPFEQIVSALLPGSKDTSRNPLVQLMFAFHPQRDLGELRLPGLASELVPGLEATRLDAEFHLFQGAGSIYGRVLYSTDLFEAKTIQNVAVVFQQMMRQGLSLPDRPIADLPLLTNGLEELAELGVLMTTETDYPRESSIIDIFRKQVAGSPEATAVIDATSSSLSSPPQSRLTYAQLDRQSDTLAAWLGQRGLAAETLVAVLAPRSCQAIVAFLGILKAHLAYVPLDVAVPAARIESILSAIPENRLVLTGSNIPAPKLSLDKVNFVSIDDITGASHNITNNTIKQTQAATTAIATTTVSCTAAPCCVAPESLAYVMFTSGSTGRPKGVMVTHRGVVRLVMDTNVATAAQVAVPVAHVTTLAFDLSTWEIYAPLLNGGTVVCIDYMTLLDSVALAQVFYRERVRAALLTPAFLKQCLAASETTAMLARLETLLACGDRLDAHDAVAICDVAKCGIVNAYGPTENTTFSTMYHVKPGEHSAKDFVNGVPIGKPISNSGAYIMDRQQQLVPPGIMGELVVTGDGLARGYLDEALNASRFMQVQIDGRAPVQVYRTGDRVRYRPKDGQIEFFGRMDQQIKIRGHRIEPGEVEQVMLRQHTLVQDAAVVVRVRHSQEPEMMAFVTARPDSMEQQDEVGSQVEGWGNHFETATYAELDTVSNFGNDFRGWTSVYTRKPIERPEMQDWLDDTIRTVVAGREGSGRVLEIGTGSGMLLFNLGRAGLVDRYVGLEPSRSAVAFVTKSAKSVPFLDGRVEMHVGTATDAGRLAGFRPDLVLLNSVIQYFPTPEYLMQVVETLVRMPGAKQLFFGDVRSYALNDVFLASRALYAENVATKAGFREKINEMTEREEELLIDPTFFTCLTSRLPDFVKHVEIIPKRMRATNELSAFRYAAVIHLEIPVGTSVQSVSPDTWIDFTDSGLDRQGLLGLLKSSLNSSSSTPIPVGNIPFNKTILERQVIHSLSLDCNDQQDRSTWLAAVHSEAARCPSLSGAELVDLAAEAGFRVELSWARQRSQQGALDAIFHRHTQATRVLFQFPADEAMPSSCLTNRPLRRLQSRRVEGLVRERLQALLPSYMVPARIVALEQMPLNPSGKVDRKELARMAQVIAPKQVQVKAGDETAAPGRKAPRNEVEAAVCDEFALLLGIETGSISDNFFDRGGHSLMATKLAARLSRRLGICISVKDVFEQPMLADLAATCAARRSSTTHKAIPASAAFSGPVEQSFAQRRLWFLDQLNIARSAYILPHATRLRGPLRISALEKALHALQKRHETLRTTFEESKGIALQRVRPNLQDLRIVHVRDGDYAHALRQEQTAPFDLSSEPGWRVCLLCLGEEKDDFILSIVMHHIISDGWSIDILRRELEHLYAAAMHEDGDLLLSLSPLPVQYRDFSLWQKQPEQAAEHQSELEYWKQELADSLPAEIITDRPRPEALSGQADAVEMEINSAVYQRLEAFCRRYQTTPFTVLLAAFRAAQYRLTGAQSATIGTPIANRNRPELENLIGFFVNTQCIKTVIDDEETFTFDDLVRQVSAKTTDAFENQDVPFERIVAALLPSVRDTSRNPLVQIMFALHSQQDLERVQLEGMVAEPVDGALTTRFDLEVHLMQHDGSLGGKLLYSTDLFEPRTIQGVVACFQEVLICGLAQPQTPISTLKLTYGLAQLQQDGLLNSENTEYPRDSDVVSVFRQRVLETPQATAVVEASSPRDKSEAGIARLGYIELDQQSDKIESWLRRRRVAAESLVGVLAPRSCEAVTAFLGVLKANLAYIPLDINAPNARLREIISSVPGRRLVLLGRHVPAPDILGQLEGVELVRIDDILSNNSGNEHDLSSVSTATSTAKTRPSSTRLAYVIFTSGSTGKPKGVMVEHRSILRLVLNTKIPFPTRTHAVAHLASIAFDAATWEVYSALLNGGTVVCIDYATVLDPPALASACIRHDVRAALFSPALLTECLNQVPHLFTKLDVLLAGGERLRPQDALRAAGMVRHAFFNAYGPTENTVISTMYRVRGGESLANGVPIGRAYSNSGAYVMDRRQQLVPLGVVGELVVTGDGLARGYTDASLDSGRFVEVKINGAPVRAYRTGDQARARPTDGEVEFFGRLDQQIKIRGHRVETGDVEQAILRQDLIRDAAVVLRMQRGTHPQMVGFVVIRAESLAAVNGGGTAKQNGQSQTQNHESKMVAVAALAGDMIRAHLQVLLPSYMIPEQFIVLDQLPQNSSGKVDRKKLADMALTAPQWDNVKHTTDKAFVPTGEVEKTIHEAIAAVINLSPAQIRAGRSFISLGGDSISAMQVMALCRQRGVAVRVEDILKSASIVHMAANATKLDSLGAETSNAAVEEGEIEVEKGYGPYCLSPIQKLHFAQFPEGEDYYNQSMLLKLRRKTSESAVLEALAEIVRRHPMLRARFHKDASKDQWMQTVAPYGADGAFSCSSSNEATWEDAKITMMQAAQCLDIRSGPVFAARYLQVQADSDSPTALFLVAHHLAIDLVSWRVLLRDLEQLINRTPLAKMQDSWSYQRWVRSLYSYAGSEADAAAGKTLPPQSMAIPEPNLEFWGLEADKPHDSTDLVQGSFTLSPLTTQALLDAAGRACKAEMQDVVLAMAAYTFATVFPERSAPPFHVETHGRQGPQDTATSVHDTVGWFTAIVPLIIPVTGANNYNYNYIDSVVQAKDLRRTVPKLGVPYFTAQMLRGSFKTPLEIVVNYLGRFQQLERSDSLFELLPPSMRPADVRPSASRLSIIDIAALVERDALTVSWSFDAAVRHQNRLAEWFALYERTLLDLTTVLQEAAPRLTRSDLPLLSISHAQLEPLNRSLAAITGAESVVEEVENVFPTSAMQRGILISQSKDASQYDVHVVWEITPPRGVSCIDVDRLQQAWRRVVQRHPMLRAVFVDSGTKENDDFPIDQAVLKTIDPSVSIASEVDETAAMQVVWDMCRGPLAVNAPAHRLGICAGPGAKVYAHLQVSHAIVDASSLRVILRDWARAYTDNMDPDHGLCYSRYVAHIQEKPLEATLKFWTKSLEGATACHFPPLTDGVVPTGPGEMRSVRMEVKVPLSDRLGALAKSLNVSIANIFQLAWALVLRSYTDLEDVCYGYIVSGRDVGLDGIADAVGPFINTLVSRVDFHCYKSSAAALRHLFDIYVDSLSHQQAPLANVTHALGVAGGQLFNTVLSVQKLPAGTPQGQELSFRAVRGTDPTEFDIMINVLSGDSLNFSLDFRNNFLTQAQAANLGHALLQALSAIESSPNAGFDSLDLIPPEHISQLKSWGEDLPPLVDETVHGMFGKACQAYPDASAIHAWDGHLSYTELDDASSRLAALLMERGVKPGTFVAMCFEKSVWVPVSYLAIHKAGAAFLLLETDAPRERTDYMLAKSDISVVICSPRWTTLVQAPGRTCVVVSRDTIAALPAAPSTDHFPQVPSSYAAYVVFTSGTTGQPKGAVMEHGAICTEAVAQAKDMFIGPESRCLQFSSFAFDICILEMVTPLFVGGCVCVAPRQDMLTDLPRVVKEMQATWAFLTPSFVRTLDPDVGLDPLKTLFLGGEPLSQKDVETWADRLHLANGYGPAECSVICVVKPHLTKSTDASNTGHPMGIRFWVTKAGDRNRLVPIGGIGELLLEGAPVSRGYINDPDMTAKAFVSGLAWAPLVARGPETRFYGTGDLVRLNSDGSIAFIGRRDGQLKIHGQRMEMGEIQSHLAAMDAVRHPVVLSPDSGPLQGSLVAVLELACLPPVSVSDGHGLALVTPAVRLKAVAAINTIRSDLASRLPAYMIPSTWIAVQEVPRMVSGKQHVPAVQAWVRSLDDKTYREILAAGIVNSELDRADTVAMQISRQVASLLGGAASETIVGKDLVPTQYGMDSITAISFSSWLRKTFSVTIPIAALLSPQTSVRTLASLVAKKKNAGAGPAKESDVAVVGATPPTNLLAEVQRLANKLSQLQNKVKQQPSTKTISTIVRSQPPSTFLVTGCTGFLGSQIVKQLLCRASVSRVFCLVRADSDAQAWERMMDVARKGSWWQSDLTARLVAWRGDLAQPQLGLDANRWAYITSGKINAVLHNGAVVHWHLGYTDVQAANVNSTLDLLSVSALSRPGLPPPRFVYVSGGYFGAALEADEQVADKLRRSSGYAQSKFVSEMLVRRCAGNGGAVVKPGLIIGDAEQGLCNLDDFVWRVAASAVRVGAYNADEAADADAWLLVAGSDQVATAVIDACNNKAGSEKAAAPVAPVIRFVDGVPVRELWRLLSTDKELNFALRPKSRHEWMQALKQDLERKGPDHPLFPVAEFLWANEGTIGIQRLKDETPVCPPADVLARLRRSLLYLKEVGFFESDSGLASNKAVFTRASWKRCKTAA